jgi:acetyl esterase/lipase
MRFASHPVGKHTPRMQILIYPVLQMFDFMLPSYMGEHYQFFTYTIDHTLSAYFNEKIDKSIYANKHLTVQEKKKYRKYVDWSLIPAKYRTLYQKPLTDDQEGDPSLIEKAKKVLNSEVSPLLVEDQQLAKLPPTYILSVGHDRLRDEAFIYEGRLKRAGVSVMHNHYEHTFHGSAGFVSGPFELEIAQQMVGDIVKYINENL